MYMLSKHSREEEVCRMGFLTLSFCLIGMRENVGSFLELEKHLQGLWANIGRMIGFWLWIKNNRLYISLFFGRFTIHLLSLGRIWDVTIFILIQFSFWLKKMYFGFISCSFIGFLELVLTLTSVLFSDKINNPVWISKLRPSQKYPNHPNWSTNTCNSYLQ